MKRPIVTLVGRTNVGKSTLFNKLTGKKKAITVDTFNVTRDRVYEKVEWLNKEFILSDTGGLDISNTEKMNNEVRQQVKYALNESDVILLVTDGREGLCGHDRQIADVIRKYNKKVIIVVNKIDGHDIPPEVYDFYQLGFENLCVISAENSYGLGDLLDEILNHIDTIEINEDVEENTRIAIIGKPNAGKSSLVNLLLDDNRMIVTDIAGTTRDAVDSYWNFNDKEYVLVDTAGLRKKKKVKENVEYYSVKRTLDAIDKSDICILMLDATHGISEQDTKIAGYAHDNKKAVIICVNKWDLIDKQTNTMRNMQDEIKTKLAYMSYAPVVFISVTENKRISKLTDAILHVEENYGKRIKTGTLNNILKEAILMSPPPSDKGKRLKIYYISQVQDRPPKFLLSVNDRELMHFSYLRYIENQIRNNFDFTGVPFSFEIRQRGEK